MSEFEWRNGMRVLADPAQPSRDLWPDIHARIAAQTRSARRRPRWQAWAAIAATVVVAIGAVMFMQRVQPIPGKPGIVSNTTSVPAADPARDAALGWATPTDPRVALAALHLDAASADLQAALEQRPDAVFLVGLLNRTNGKRIKLLRQTPYTG